MAQRKLPLSKLLSSQDIHSDSSLVRTNASVGPESIRRRKREKCKRKSNKEFNLEAVGFRTYEAPLFQVLQELGHAQFMAMIGLTQFLRLSWTHVHIELAIEFLKNYRKKKSSRISLSSSVRSKKITLTKKLIASTFQLSSTGYRHKNKQLGKQAVSSLFDPVRARRNGYYIRDCKEPAYFERLEALNRLICFKPPGHLISAILVDVVIHAATQRVDWAGVLLFSLMKELDRVTSSLHQTPCTLVGVHISLILSNLKIVTSDDSLARESFPYILLDGYSPANSVASDSFASSPKSSLPGSPRCLNPGSRLAEILCLNKEVQTPTDASDSFASSPKSSLPGSPRCLNPGSRLAEILCLKKEVQKPTNASDSLASSPKSSLPGSLRSLKPWSRLAEILGLNKDVQKLPDGRSPHSSQLGSYLAEVFGKNVRGQKLSTVPFGSIRIDKRDIPYMAANTGGKKSSTIPSGSVQSGRKPSLAANTNTGVEKSSRIPSSSVQSGRKPSPAANTNTGVEKSSRIPSGSVQSGRKNNLSPAARVRVYMKKVFEVLSAVYLCFRILLQNRTEMDFEAQTPSERATLGAS